MKKDTKPRAEPEMAKEYDFSKGVRGKYAARYVAGSNAVILAPDVAKLFPDSETVNEVLRAIAKLLALGRTKSAKKPSPSKGPTQRKTKRAVS